MMGNTAVDTTTICAGKHSSVADPEGIQEIRSESHFGTKLFHLHEIFRHKSGYYQMHE